jgi:hypothetical protein
MTKKVTNWYEFPEEQAEIESLIQTANDGDTHA